MIAQGTNPGGPTDRPRSRSLNLDHPARPIHAADPTNASRATFDGFERSINSSTLCPENRGRYMTTVFGGFLGYLLKQRSWQIEAEHSLHRARYEEGVRFLDTLSDQIGRRFFLLDSAKFSVTSDLTCGSSLPRSEGRTARLPDRSTDRQGCGAGRSFSSAS